MRAQQRDAVIEMLHHPLRAATHLPSHKAFEVWFAIDAPARPLQLRRWVADLAAPEFAVRDVTESARLQGAPGRYQAHWHCRIEETAQGSDEFAVLRFLKRLTGAGFELLRFYAERH